MIDMSNVFSKCLKKTSWFLFYILSPNVANSQSNAEKSLILKVMECFIRSPVVIISTRREKEAGRWTWLNTMSPRPWTLLPESRSHAMDLNTSHDPTLPDSFVLTESVSCCVFNMFIRVNKTYPGHSPWCWPESARPRQGCCEHRRCRLRRLMSACCWLLLRRSWSWRETAAAAACSCIHLR